MFFIFDAGYARSLAQDRGVLPAEFKSQLIFLLPSVLVGVLCSRVRPNAWMKSGAWIFFGILFALVIVARFGISMNGARRWLGVGSFSVQPAEFAKVASIVYLSAVFAQRKAWPANIKPRKDFAHWLTTIGQPKFLRMLPGLLILATVLLIDKEPDLGTAAVIAVVGFAIFVAGGVSKKSLIAALALAGIGCAVVVKAEPYRMERIKNHLQRWNPDNVDDESYQTVQSELAMATGGIGGVGIANGRAKQVIPATTTDFVMATVGEEFGLTGSIVVLAVLGALVWRLLYLSSLATTRFARLVLFGTGVWIAVQTCVNIMMANGFLPAIGIPLPFISSGGSSLLALWGAIGICQSVAASPVLVEKAKAEEGYGPSGPPSSRAVVTPQRHRIVA